MYKYEEDGLPRVVRDMDGVTRRRSQSVFHIVFMVILSYRKESVNLGDNGLATKSI